MSARRYASDVSDDDIVAAVRRGARIHHILARLELPSAARKTVHRRLDRLEAAGRVVRPARLQAVNSHFWQVVP